MKCCICKNAGKPTYHHVLPSCYIKFMPIEIKSKLYGHLIKICKRCHQDYEKQGELFKGQLLEIFNIKQDPFLYGMNKALAFVFILRKRDGLIMKDREIKEEFVKKYFDVNVSFEDARKQYKKTLNLNNPNKKLLQCFPSYESFYCLWRDHFIYHMKPKCNLSKLKFKIKDNQNVKCNLKRRNLRKDWAKNGN